MNMYLSFYSPICLSKLYIYQSIGQFIYLHFANPSICTYIYLSIFQVIYLSINLPICLSGTFFLFHMGHFNMDQSIKFGAAFTFVWHSFFSRKIDAFLEFLFKTPYSLVRGIGVLRNIKGWQGHPPPHVPMFIVCMYLTSSLLSG